MHLQDLLGFFIDQNNKSPYSAFVYFNQRNPYLSAHLKPEKGTPLGQSRPVYAIIGSASRVLKFAS